MTVATLSIADQVAIARQREPGLPPVPHDGRWNPARKQAVVSALRRRDLTEAQAMEAWDISAEELRGWVERFNRFGRQGLEVQRLQTVGR